MKTYRDLYRASAHPDQKMIAALDALEELNPSCLGEEEFDFPAETYEDPSGMLIVWLAESVDLGLISSTERDRYSIQLRRYARNRPGAL